MELRRANLLDARCEYEAQDPPGYRAGAARLGPAIGAAMLGATVYELPEGQSICPYHYEYGNEEWLIVLDGRATLRCPGGEADLGPGDVVCFPAGPAGAHKVTNRGAAPVRVVMLSTEHPPYMVVYPDSDKIGASSGDPGADPRDRILTRRGESLGYYDGE